MLIRFLLTIVLALWAVPTLADSTINPTQPAASAPMASAPVRNNFLAAYNDVRSILGMYRGATAPLAPIKGQFWMDSTGAPSEIIKQYDGASWVQWGTLNTTTHTFTPAAAGVVTNLLVNGTAGNGYIDLTNQSVAPGTPSAATRLFADSTNRLSWKGTNGFVRTFDGTANTANRVYTLPDASGTVTALGNTATGILDLIGSTRGSILYRGAAGWEILPPSASGRVLTDGGVGADPSWGVVSGTGTVTSVALTAPAIFTVGGSPITTNGTLTLTAAGTSGGIPYFNAATTMASSGVLTASAIVLGGGAGASPTVLASLGTTTTVLHGNAAGAPTFGAVSLTADVSGILPSANGGTGLASPTAHAILAYQGASAAVAIGPSATTGACLASTGSGTDPAFVAGCRVLIATLTASASASLSDTTSFTSTYSTYEIEFRNILPATNSTFCRLRINSAGVQTTTYVTSINGTPNSTTQIPCSNQGNVVGNAGTGISGLIRMFGPSGTAAPKMVNGLVSFFRSDATTEDNTVAGFWNGGNGAVTGIEISMGSGNITSGVVKIYGIP